MKKGLPKSILLLFSLLLNKANAQDIHFSQFFETPSLRNPALAGINKTNVRLQAMYRNQWNSVTVPYQTGLFSGEGKLFLSEDGNDFWTIGGTILYDVAGSSSLSSTHVLPVLNYHKSLDDESNKYISLGFMGGWVQRRIDRSKITTNSQYDGAGYNPALADGETFTKNNYTYMDASVGVSFSSQIGGNEDNNFYIGAAYHHFNKPKRVSFYGNEDIEMTPKIVASLGVRMSFAELSYFTLYADYSKQGSSNQTAAGVMYSWKLENMENPKYILHAGTLFRWKDALIPVIKMERKPLSVCLSYDANVSPLKFYSNGQGGFELSLVYQKL